MRVCSVDEVARDQPVDRPLSVHVDVDVVDPRDMPAVNYPAPDGPSFEAVRAALSGLVGTGRVVAASVSSWNPALPGADQAAAATRRIMGSFEL